MTGDPLFEDMSVEDLIVYIHEKLEEHETNQVLMHRALRVLSRRIKQAS